MVYLEGIPRPASNPISDDLLIAANRQAVYGQVARWLIHDLRSPAQALTLMAELVLDEPEPGDDGVAETIRQATVHLARSLELLDRLLRQVPAPAEPAPLSLADSFGFLKALYRSHRTSVALDIEPALSAALPAVRGVEQELEQILLNLLVNALEALEDRIEATIRVRAEPVDGAVRLTVEDNGPGVFRDLGEHIFEPFVSGRPGGKAGLGLAAARVLAERWGGALVWEQESRAGARFALTLPRWNA